MGHNTVSGERLGIYVERLEFCNKRQSVIAGERRSILVDAKKDGFDTATIGRIIKIRQMDADRREEQDALLDQYMSALGEFASTPLGRAGADKLNKNVSYIESEPGEF